MSTESSSGEVGSCSGSAVDGDLFFYDETVFDVSSDVVAAVSVRDSQRFVWVEPNLVFAAVHHGRCESFLEVER